MLRTFVAAFEEENFTKAARRLHATQPGVSVQIATLEAHVGTLLFDRNARSVTPTIAGRRLYPKALRLIQDFNSAAQEIRALAGAVSGRVAIGVPPTLSPELVPPVLARFLAAYPHSDVHIVEGGVDALLAQVEARTLDLALVAHRVEQTALITRRLCPDRIIAAVGPLSGIDPERPIQFDSGERYKIVVPSILKQALSGVLDEPLRSGPLVPERLIELDGLACTLQLVAETDWIALLPSSAGVVGGKDSRVQVAAIAGNALTLDYHIVHARTEPLSAAAVALVDLISAELSRITALWQSRAAVSARRQRGVERPMLKLPRIDWKSPATTQSVA